MSVVTMRKLLEAGVHYGHQTRRWDPKQRPNIYAAKNGVHIINLANTQEALDTAYAALKGIAENGGRVLFVGTKKQAQAIVMEEALRSGSFYVTQRWLGGTLTNYRTIQKRIRRLLEIEQMEETGALENYTKKEIAGIMKEKNKLDNFLGGIKEMKKLPDAVFVVDPKEDNIAVLEARKLHIPVFGICDTNCDPAIVDYAIPGNDDAVRAIKLLVSAMADAIVEAKGGILEVAYVADEQPEVTMEDVIINVQEVAAENERRRKARYEERRQQQNSRNQQRRPRRQPENKEAKAEAPAAVEEAAEEVKEEAAEAPVEE
jgi:small subunit ribosomal protein S2